MTKRSMMLATACCLAGALVLGVTGCQDNKADSNSGTASMGVINAECPLMGGPVKPDGGTVSYNGHEIGFCCPGCIDGWNKMPDAEKKAYVDSQLKANMGVVGAATKSGSCCDAAGECSPAGCDDAK